MATFSVMRLKVITGEQFDFEAAAQKGVTPMQMMNETPGLVECPKCGQRHYREGIWVRCAACSKTWRIA